MQLPQGFSPHHQDSTSGKHKHLPCAVDGKLGVERNITLPCSEDTQDAGVGRDAPRSENCGQRERFQFPVEDRPGDSRGAASKLAITQPLVVYNQRLARGESLSGVQKALNQAFVPHSRGGGQSGSRRSPLAVYSHKLFTTQRSRQSYF